MFNQYSTGMFNQNPNGGGTDVDISGKQDKVIPSQIGNIQILDAGGNTIDGGYTIQQLLYSLKPKTYSFENQTTVTIEHNLGRLPIVQIYNENDETITNAKTTLTNTDIFIDFQNNIITGKVIYI